MNHDVRLRDQDMRSHLFHVTSQTAGNTGYTNGFVNHGGQKPNAQSAGRRPSAGYMNGPQDLMRQRTIATNRTASIPNNGLVWNQQHAEVKHLSWSKRMQHVTWAYFTLTMATGGIANVLHTVPFRFRGLYTIGCVFFLANIVLYLLIWAMILTRFILYPHTFRNSLHHPTESLFVPAFAVSFGTILINIVEYGADYAGEWLTRAVLILFWFDCALAIILSLTIYMVLWSTMSFTIAQMTPIWIFPAYPLLIIGPHAANISARLPSANSAIQVIIGGFTIQGIGFLVALTIYSAFVYRLMTEKLPAERLRPGMFVSVGPSAFTVSGTIGMAQNLQSTIATQATFMNVPGLLAAQILTIVGNWMSLWLWGLAIWFFFISLVSNVQCFEPKHRVPFAMTWFSFVFPQTALVTATFAIAEAFNVQAIRILGCVMTVMLLIVWIFVVGMMIRAIIRHDILWPEKGEDKSEGGFMKNSLATTMTSNTAVADEEQRVGGINGEDEQKQRESSILDHNHNHTFQNGTVGEDQENEKEEEEEEQQEQEQEQERERRHSQFIKDRDEQAMANGLSPYVFDKEAR